MDTNQMPLPTDLKQWVPGMRRERDVVVPKLDADPSDELCMSADAWREWCDVVSVVLLRVCCVVCVRACVMGVMSCGGVG